jgi:hypothetical protein
MQGRLNGVHVHIWSADPAIDHKATGVDKAYEKALEGDLASLPLREGRQPVKWRLMSLSERAYTEFSRVALFEVLARMSKGESVMIDQGAYGLRRDAVRRGLVGADGAVNEKGEPLKLETDDTPAGKVLTTESIETLYRCYGPRLIGELGQKIIDLSEVGPT